MTVFYFDHKPYQGLQDESLLDTLLRHGVALPFSCKKGQCRSCLVKQTQGNPALASQKGLAKDWQDLGLVYACLCQPTVGEHFSTAQVEQHYQNVVLVDKHQLSDDVMKLLLKPTEPIAFMAGQCISLRSRDGTSRSYSLVNSDNKGDKTGVMELHVQRKKRGQFSQWLFEDVAVGETLQLHGPWGNCCYLPAYCKDTLVLIANGTGLGPCLGIANAALMNGHQGQIFLYHGAQYPSELYLHRSLLKLMLEQRQFHYQACIQAESARLEIEGSRIVFADPFTLAMTRHTIDRQHRLFICGEPKAVSQAQEAAFLNGVPIERVHKLSYDYRDLRKRPRSEV